MALGTRVQFEQSGGTRSTGVLAVLSERLSDTMCAPSGQYCRRGSGRRAANDRTVRESGRTDRAHGTTEAPEG